MFSYNINYNDYHANLCDGLQSILASSEMSDVTLAVEGKYFKAHQVILSMFSIYFRELFHVTPSRNTIFFMKNVKHRIMKNLLLFMYEGKVQIDSEDFQLFMDTANELRIKGLVNGIDREAAEQSREQVHVGRRLSQVSNDDDTVHITDRTASYKTASTAIEQEAEPLKLRNNVPVQISCPVSYLPLTTSQSAPEAQPESDIGGIQPKVNTDDAVDPLEIGPTEIHDYQDILDNPIVKIEVLEEVKMEEAFTCSDDNLVIVTEEAIEEHLPAPVEEEQLLNKDQESEKAINEGHICYVCDKVFLRKASMVHHIRMHAGGRPYACHLCDMRFTKWSLLQQHLRTHTSEENLVSLVCTKEPATAQQLGKHYRCSYCDKQFTNTTTLKTHVKIHTGTNNFSCGQCGKVFKTKAHLSHHMLVHNAEKMFMCELCPKRFAQRSNLGKHYKWHQTKNKTD